MIEAATWIITVAVRTESNILTFLTTELLDTGWLVTLQSALSSQQCLVTLAGHALAKLRKSHERRPSLLRRSRTCPVTMAGSAAPALAKKWLKAAHAGLTSDRNSVNLSIYLPFYIWVPKQVSTEYRQQGRGGRVRNTKTIHINPANVKTDGGYTALFYDKLRWSWAELQSPGSMSVLAV